MRKKNFVPADISIYIYKTSSEVTACQAAALSTDNRWLANGNEFSPLRRGKRLKKVVETGRLLPYCLIPHITPRHNTLKSYTFVGDSAAPAGLEVISAPQPAHLRHLGSTGLALRVWRQKSCFLSLSPVFLLLLSHLTSHVVGLAEVVCG